MLHYSKRKEVNRRWLQDQSNFTSEDFVPNEDTYVAITFRKRGHTQQSRKMMDKQLQKYFDKADEASINQTRELSNNWRNLKTTYDSFMNLSPNERRRTDTANMRGYQLDRSGRILYSFEDNCVYNVRIGEQFNKIIVISKNHDLTTMEKRSVFDNPFLYEPVSPYRIQWPRADIKDQAQLSLIQIEQTLGQVSDAFKNISSATDAFSTTMSKTMADFSSSVNNMAQQNVQIQQNFEKLINKQESVTTGDELPSDAYIERYGRGTVWYHEDGHKPDGTQKMKYYTRGSKGYREKVDMFGWIDDGKFIYNPTVEAQKQPVQPITVNNTVQQENTAITPVINNLLTQLNEIITQMSSFDIVANMSNMYTAIIQAAADIRTKVEEGLSSTDTKFTDFITKTSETLDNILATVNTKLKSVDYDTSLKQLSDSYQSLAKSIKDSEDNWGQKIMDVINKQNALFKKTEEHLQQSAAAARPNQEAIVPKIEVNATAELSPNAEQEITSIKELFTTLNEQYASYLQQVQQINTQLAGLTSITSTTNLLVDINTSINNSRAFYQNLLNNIETKLLESHGETRQLLTNGQAQNRQMLTDIQQNVSDGMTNLGNTIAQNNQLTNMQTVMLNQIGVNTERMLAQQAYNAWLIENGFKYAATIQDQIYNAYKALCDRPITPKYLIDDEVPIQNNLLRDIPDNVKIEVLEDANQIVPAESVEIVQRNGIDDLEQLRDQYVFFMNIMTNYLFDQDFINFAKRIGFVKIFNAYIQRNSNPELFNIFIQLANRKVLTESDYQLMEQLFNSIPCDMDVNIENLINKTAADVYNMWNVTP